ncbi:3-keto-disaccharide hydrolase [Stratiformator vulcanicus]|uniref:3-keto-alpha-glucoside-1,2-lyase/3-keto-2-hydroxy-glucal hydratase domain-containing protein n=1 Tax=Stratiformator vulcanicus TaxID=2527980 RepID=A0A517R7K7_9PLAN|nr:DUF1080 domain-containing protein [Stratiformator vulcanicus]QDT39813.1 hypothetical protein Pan189_42250 [Stratiformator vulcanicus]
MIRSLTTAALVCSAATLLAQGSERPFDAENLDAWDFVASKEGFAKDDVWSIEDGVVRTTGKPSGYIKTKKSYQDYKLDIEWRWPPGTEGGNNGVLVHATDPNALGVWPQSLEVQLFKNNAGDFWVIGTEIDVPAEGVPGYEKRIQGRRHLNFTDGSEKPLGEWNKMTIICRDETVTVFVNGDLVNYGFDSSVDEGSICLQSEGAACAYRNLVITPLED